MRTSTEPAAAGSPTSCFNLASLESATADVAVEPRPESLGAACSQNLLALAQEARHQPEQDQGGDRRKRIWREVQACQLSGEQPREAQAQRNPDNQRG